MTDNLPIRPSVQSGTQSFQPKDPARDAAKKLEASFLAEMLKSSGLGAQNHSFAGGVGEDQFASFRRQALADAMVNRGGIGLADIFYKALKEKGND